MNINSIDITKYGFSIIQVETIASCNMKCDFCGYPLRHDKDSMLPTDVTNQIIDSLAVSDGFKHICFSQFNEPLMDNRIYDFIKRAKNRNLPIMIVTNGLLFNSKEVIAKLVDTGVDYIKVSLQLLNQDLFSKVRKPGYDFNRYKEGIFNFLAAADKGRSAVTVDIACNFMSGANIFKRLLGLEHGDPSVYGTVNDLKQDLNDFLRELQNYSLSFKYNRLNIDKFLENVNSNYLSEPGYRVTNNIAIKIKPFIYGRRIKDFYPVSKTRPCISNILGILADGSVVPCCAAYDDNLSLGNVCRQSLNLILESGTKILNDMRMNGVNMPSTCKHCMGAPTKRGVILKNLKNAIARGSS